MPPVGPTELILVLAIVVLVFGAGRLGEVGGALGRGIREFRQATEEHHSATSSSGQPNPPPACRRCGLVLHSGARFCGSCGTAVDGDQREGTLVSTASEDAKTSIEGGMR
jgi:sec-independent protein translocase protein TatA